MPLDTPLHRAAAKGQEEDVKNLLASGADVDSPGANLRTPLHRAAGAGELDTLRLLLSKGANPLALDNAGRQPIHWAATATNSNVQTNEGCVKELLSRGSDINSQSTHSGWSPLHYAASNNKKEMVLFLVAEGADRFLQDKQGKTPYDVCIESGHEPLSVLEKDFDIAHFLQSMKLLKESQKDPAEMLKYTLKYKRGKTIFLRHLSYKKAEENLLFLVHVEDLRAEKNLKEKEKKAYFIWKVYVVNDAPLQVYFPCSATDAMNKKLAQLEPKIQAYIEELKQGEPKATTSEASQGDLEDIDKCFAEAYDYIHYHVARDSFLSFTRTEIFRDFIFNPEQEIASEDALNMDKLVQDFFNSQLTGKEAPPSTVSSQSPASSKKSAQKSTPKTTTLSNEKNTEQKVDDDSDEEDDEEYKKWAKNKESECKQQ